MLTIPAKLDASGALVPNGTIPATAKAVRITNAGYEVAETDAEAAAFNAVTLQQVKDAASANIEGAYQRALIETVPYGTALAWLAGSLTAAQQTAIKAQITALVNRRTSALNAIAAAADAPAVNAVVF